MFDFVEVKNQMHANNLILIDSALPKILACMVLRFYLGSKSNTSELVASIEEDNLLYFHMSNNHPFYLYKVKSYVNHVAQGMLPNQLWKGGCHLYKESKLGSFLIDNTKFEEELKPNHNFKNIYSEGGKLYIDLN